MNLEELLNFFNNLPPSVLKTNGNPNISNLIGSIVLTLSSYTGGWEQWMENMSSLSPQAGNFLDSMGAYFGIDRQSNETDGNYAAKITLALYNTFGSPQAILNMLQEVYGVSATVTNLPTVGYSLSLQSYPAQYINIIVGALKYARPAGVPFYLYSATGGPTVGSSLYLGANLNVLTTSYGSNMFLGGGQIPITYTILGNTNSYITKSYSYPYFNDPVLTGQITT